MVGVIERLPLPYSRKDDELNLLHGLLIGCAVVAALVTADFPSRHGYANA